MSWPVFLFGDLMLVVGVGSLCWRFSQFRNFRRARGRVVKYESYYSADGTEVWRETVAFVAEDGKDHIFDHEVGSHPNQEEHTFKSVLYRPGCPSEATVYSGTTFWAVPIAASLPGAALIYLELSHQI